jgi:urease accessory protein UreH
MNLVGFLRSLNLDMAKIEPKANNCSEILVWHTQTLKSNTVDINPPVALAKSDSLDPLLRRMQQISLVKFNATGKLLNNILTKQGADVRI